MLINGMCLKSIDLEPFSLAFWFPVCFFLWFLSGFSLDMITNAPFCWTRWVQSHSAFESFHVLEKDLECLCQGLPKCLPDLPESPQSVCWDSRWNSSPLITSLWNISFPVAIFLHGEMNDASLCPPSSYPPQNSGSLSDSHSRVTEPLWIISCFVYSLIITAQISGQR